MAVMKHVVTSWAEASRLFEHHARPPRRGGDRRVNLGYATFLFRRDKAGPPNFAVRFHSTDVVTFLPDGSIKIATDGWLTPTTHARIEDFTPDTVRVVTRNVPYTNREKEQRFDLFVTEGDGRTALHTLGDGQPTIINPA